jgi:hypothetical protein
MFWNIILGGMVNGYLYIVGTAKSNSAIAPPFIFDVFNLLLQEVYFVPALAIMLGGLILGPIAWGVLFPLLRKLLSTFIPALRKPVESAVSAESESESVSETESAESETSSVSDTVSDTESDTESTESDTESAKKPSLLGLLAKNKTVLLVFTAIYVIIVTYVHSLQILPGVALWIVAVLMAVLMFWNIILGGMVNGYLYIVGTAKSNSAIAPPFIFDVLPIFLAGGTGFTSYVAMPSTESDGSAGIVSATKLGRMNGIGEKRVLKAYIAGYLATTVTTPIFALLMWSALGIGTAEFPAPAFPVQGAILASFASRDVTSFIDLQVFFIVMGLAVLFTKLGTDVFLGIVIGMLFPPHMAVPMMLGGLTRILIDRRYDEEKAKDLSSTIGPGLAVGASFVIPIMIILALVL